MTGVGTLETLNRYGIRYMVVGKVPKRKRFALVSGDIKAYDFVLAFWCHMCFAHTNYTVSLRELGKPG